MLESPNALHKVKCLPIALRQGLARCQLIGLSATAVYLDGQRLKMAKGETEQEHIMALEHGELMLQWEMHRPDMGQAVEITSGMLPGFVPTSPSVGQQPATGNKNATAS